ncbi:MAG: GNAT family N-acetyltransferase [Pseudomonadota bacterium]
MTDVPVRRAVPGDALAIAMLDAEAWDDSIGDGHHTWRLWIDGAYVFVAVEEIGAAEEEGEEAPQEDDAGSALTKISTKIIASSLKRLGTGELGGQDVPDYRVVEPAPPETQAIRACAMGFPTLEGDVAVHKVFTDTEYRSRGYGAAAMRALLDALDEAGVESFLTVSPSNTAAQWLYRKLGFEAIDRIADYYGPDEDRDVMRRKPQGR